MLNLFARLLASLYPPRCPYCGRLISPKEEMCLECRKQIVPCTQAISIFEQESGQNKIVCVVPFYYKDSVRRAVIHFKFYGKREYADLFAVSVCHSVHGQFPDIHFDVVTHVPLSRQRLKQRGYDQAQLLAKAVAKRQNLLCESLLYKTKDNPEQHTLSRVQRMENVLGMYAAVKKDDIHGKTILLCDDIVTTGATLRECSAILLKNGAAAVYCAAVAAAGAE